MKRSRMKFLIAMAGLVMLFAACTSRGPIQPISLSGAQESATVYVFRPDHFNGILMNLAITFQGKKVYGIGSNRYIEFQIPPGEAQKIGVQCLGKMLPIPEHHEISFHSKPNETYYFLTDLSKGFSCATIKQISDKEAKRWFQINQRQS